MHCRIWHRAHVELSAGQRHGVGSQIFDASTRYEGRWENGLQHGSGKCLGFDQHGVGRSASVDSASVEKGDCTLGGGRRAAAGQKAAGALRVKVGWRRVACGERQVGEGAAGGMLVAARTAGGKVAGDRRQSCGREGGGQAAEVAAGGWRDGCGRAAGPCGRRSSRDRMKSSLSVRRGTACTLAAIWARGPGIALPFTDLGLGEAAGALESVVFVGRGGRGSRQ